MLAQPHRLFSNLLAQGSRSGFFKTTHFDYVKQISREEIASGGTALIDRVSYSNCWIEIHKTLLPKYQVQHEYEALQKREFEILSSLDHPFILKALRLDPKVAAGEIGTTQVLVLEHINGLPLNALEDFLGALSEDERSIWAMNLLYQLISVVRYLGKKEVVHGDLSPENIIVQPGGFIKLIDFGVARWEGGTPLHFKVCGRPQFRAPELLAEGSTSHSGDIFAVAKVYEWILGMDLAEQEVHQKILRKMLDQRILPNIRAKGVDLVQGLCPLPAPGEMRQAEIFREPTKICPHTKFTRIRQDFLMAILVVIFPFVTTWTPALSRLTINTLPYSVVSIDSGGEKFTQDTPIRDLQVPSGKVSIRMVFPSQYNRQVIRHLTLGPGESAKVFEDFSKY